MPVKVNDATLNRPDGNRLIDAPAVKVDIKAFIEQLKEEKAWSKNDRNGITVSKTDGLTIVLSAFHKGAEINNLQIDGVLVLQVMEGSIRVETKEEELTLSEKQLLVVRAESQQRLIAEEDCIVLLSAIKEYGDKII